MFRADQGENKILITHTSYHKHAPNTLSPQIIQNKNK